MAELNPLGSEKLVGEEKIKRILELTYYKNQNNKTSKSSPEFISEAKTGGVYGIVKEKDAYYVKRGLNESSLDYIGGLFMKNKNKFSSYAEALKRLNLLKGQEELQEATKYVLKTNKPQEEIPVDEPTMDLPPPPSDATSGDELPSSDELSPESNDTETSTENKRSDYMSEVQKFSGKLGQELRDQKEKMESDDIKYVLNMIISAVDLDKLDLEDLEDIAKKFERDEDISSSEEPELGEPTGDELPDEDLSEVDGIEGLEEFINSPIDTNEIDLESYADIDETKNVDDEYEIDLDEIKSEINNSINNTLSKYFKH